MEKQGEKQKILIAPSVLSADFARLEGDVRSVVEAGADLLHLDVMDGVFVPPISFGEPIIRSIRALTKLPLEVHLMTVRPEDKVPVLRDIGVNRVIVHAECSPHLDRTLRTIRESGMESGVAINPGTSLAAIEEVFDISDLILIMTVNPGWGGQPFIEGMVRKVAAVAERSNKPPRRPLIEVDGGITAETARLVTAAGADILVAGTAIFGSNDRKKAIRALRTAPSRSAQVMKFRRKGGKGVRGGL